MSGAEVRERKAREALGQEQVEIDLGDPSVGSAKREDGWERTALVGTRKGPDEIVVTQVESHDRVASLLRRRLAFRKRLVDRGARLGEELRAALGDVQAILQANAELAVDGDHRLVAEAHAWCELGLVAAHEVRPFVAVHA